MSTNRMRYESDGTRPRTGLVGLTPAAVERKLEDPAIHRRHITRTICKHCICIHHTCTGPLYILLISLASSLCHVDPHCILILR